MEDRQLALSSILSRHFHMLALRRHDLRATRLLVTLMIGLWRSHAHIARIVSGLVCKKILLEWYDTLLEQRGKLVDCFDRHIFDMFDIDLAGAQFLRFGSKSPLLLGLRLIMEMS